ncbi:MAG: carboxypeptidase-like regulatory domain-containing protein [Saprospiraceae bacterium]
MKLLYSSILLVFCCWVTSPTALQAQTQRYTISGYVQDATSGEKLIAANVFDLKSLSGNVTNNYGFYSLTLPQDTVYLSVSYIGYETVVLPFYLQKDTVLNIQLKSEVELEVVEVVAGKLDRIEEQTQMSQVNVPIDQIKKIPSLLGEVDVLKVLQLLPGVQAGTEGFNGLYVRGGSPDQNLILLDGVPIYNVSHVLGVFSVFNADAIKTVTLTKGGFPARFGGRLSSVLEINMKEGNMQEYHGEGSIGLVASKLTLEGPIVKDKTSFLISGRRTYIDLLMRPFLDQDVEGSTSTPTLYFYDLNAKINHKINDKHRLYLSGYFGADVFKSKDSFRDVEETESGTTWGNSIGAFRWNYLINNKLFSNTTITYSRYNIDIFFEETTRYDGLESFQSARYSSGIEDVGVKVDFDYIPNPRHYIRFGASLTNHTYSPGAFTTQERISGGELIDAIIGRGKIASNEYALYAEDEIQFGRLKANVGLHNSAFSVEGKNYFSVQPRVGLRYLLNNGLAIKSSYSQMTQFINLLTNESLSLPTDLWVPSTRSIVPQDSWQVAGGIAKTLWKDFEFTLEGYYKKMNNVLSYKEGASFIFNLSSDWQDKVTQGDGEAYGVEFFFQRKRGKTTGWIGYTLSWNNRIFEEINSGREFPFKYDRRHDISLVASHQFNKTISMTAAWIYGTGNSLTLPLFRYNTAVPNGQGGLNITEVETIGNKNEFRAPAYHRLDVSIEFFKKKRKYERKWVISAYNAYNRRNPFYIRPGVNDNGQRVFKQISLLPIIPSISYNFKF